MKKTSQQIYDEILTEKLIDSLGEDKNRFESYINEFKSMGPKDLESFEELLVYINKYPQLNKYIHNIFQETTKNILLKLGYTLDLFEKDIKRLEKINV